MNRSFQRSGRERISGALPISATNSMAGEPTMTPDRSARPCATAACPAPWLRRGPGACARRPRSGAQGRTLKALSCLALAAALAGCAATPLYEAPRVDSGAATQALKKLPRKQGDRVAVSINEFRSAVTEIPARGATDMFKTALVQSGQFRVVERARLEQGVLREKQLGAQGLTAGKSAQQLLREAQYLFEGAITDASPSETQRSGAIGIAGAEIGGGTNRDHIGIDVRVVDVASGDIVDVVTVRKSIASDSANVSGLGNLIATMRIAAGRAVSPYTPDIRVEQRRKESLDQALRAAINEAVATLSQRFEH
jgi:curli biogenesis system outer membrane secretion channel CsgG